MRNKFSRDFSTGVIGVVLGIFIIILSLRLPESTVPDDIGPAVFPIIAALIIAIPSLFLVLKNTKKVVEEKAFFQKDEWKRFAALMAVMFLYVILLSTVGFLIATPIVLVIVCIMFSQGKKIPVWHFVIYAMILTAIIYICFYKGMGLKLPKGSIVNLTL